jgi:nonsense-mediated mRNA decay protein 3
MTLTYLDIMKSCPQCGRRESECEEQFVGAFCPGCFSESRSLFSVRAPLELEHCPKCGKSKFQKDWERPTEERLSQYLSSRVRSAYPFEVLECKASSPEKNQLLVEAEVSFQLPQGSCAKKGITRTIALIANLCPECGQRSGGYYEAIIQLRGDPERVARKAALLKAVIGNESFVSREEKLREGADLYVGSSKAAASALSKLGLRHSHSAKLAGKKHGRNLYRRSYCVRL